VAASGPRQLEGSSVPHHNHITGASQPQWEQHDHVKIATPFKAAVPLGLTEVFGVKMNEPWFCELDES
jgi:hypothetical protein